MAKWADYLISQVSYDSSHLITEVKQHRDNGNKASVGEVVDRNTLANNLGHGVRYMTVYGGLGRVQMGKNVRYFKAYEHHYIRIDNNKVMTDNLGELPHLGESQQEEKPALPETKPKPKPAVETKPLSALSSAFFAEQVEKESEPTALEADVVPEPAKVEAEVAPEPAKVEAEVVQKETKKKVMKTKSSAKKKATTKKKPVRKKAAVKKKPAKKKASVKKKPAKKKASVKKKRA